MSLNATVNNRMNGLSAMADAELEVVVADGLLPLAPEAADPDPLLGAVALGFGAPKAVAPLGIGPGSADAEAPGPVKAPMSCYMQPE